MRLLKVPMVLHRSLLIAVTRAQLNLIRRASVSASVLVIGSQVGAARALVAHGLGTLSDATGPDGQRYRFRLVRGVSIVG